VSKILLIGFGGAGRNIAKDIYVATGYDWIAVDVFSRVNEEFPSEKIYYLNDGKPVARLLSEKDITQTMPRLFSTIEARLRGCGKLILVAGLGGRTGGPSLREFATLLKSQKIKFKTAVILPFAFEGRERNEYAQKLLDDLKAVDGKLISYKMQCDGGPMNHKNQSLCEYFSAVNRHLIDCLKSCR
jgi:cell division GTPase FtsZ